MVNATRPEIEAARRGPVKWDVAVHGSVLAARFDQITTSALPRRPALDTRRARAALRRSGGMEASMGAPGWAHPVPTVPPEAARPSRSIDTWRRRLEHAARVAMETDLVRAAGDVDAIFTHLRGVRSVPRSVPIVRSTNGVIPELWTWRREGGDTTIRDAHCALERSLAGRAELVMCWTQHGADNLVAAGADPARICVVPPILDLSDPEPMTLPPTGHMRAVFVGGLAVQKGLPDVLEALRAAPEVELHIVGPVPPHGEHPPRTVWHGPLAPSRTAGLLQAADVLVVPARFESFGVTHLEAMRLGVAVIGSTIGTTSEIVGDTGVLVPPGDVEALSAALNQLARTPSDRARLARAGQARYEERYAPEVAAAALEASLLGRS